MDRVEFLCKMHLHGRTWRLLGIEADPRRRLQGSSRGLEAATGVSIKLCKHQAEGIASGDIIAVNACSPGVHNCVTAHVITKAFHVRGEVIPRWSRGAYNWRCNEEGGQGGEVGELRVQRHSKRAASPQCKHRLPHGGKQLFAKYRQTEFKASGQGIWRRVLMG
jgi:hypothetical protein